MDASGVSATTESKGLLRARYVIPLVFFAGLVVLFAVGLQRDPRLVPSPFIDKPAPAFALPALHDPSRTITQEDLKGHVSLFNVWASWCVACRDEHPLLMELARLGLAPIFGLNYKDDPNDAISWLNRFGDPYSVSAMDREGVAGIEWGVYGVPETFIVDSEGVIRYKHIGPISADELRDKIIPLVRELGESSG